MLKYIKDIVITTFVIISFFIGSFLCFISGGHKYGEPLKHGKERGCRKCRKCGKLKGNLWWL